MDVYVENQNHERSLAGADVNRRFARILSAAAPSSLLSGVHPHGDTMFNIPQLNMIESEFDGILARRPDLADDIAELRGLLEEVRRRRGYLWICGD
ncbi:hypothetical protein [Actinokineospora fastidiosa]|uniref:Uncharacterized protein n=1 Tax=Actinokineospora fastidiosa TaxID=1816 RepID=A0A918LHS2_9PSEU|nr:hypothetical protein [Actinokineospora fastidiosa]GGS52868.1 hypothetical protein GCM10010171_54970 [Actinokineospora fastidiosa]